MWEGRVICSLSFVRGVDLYFATGVLLLDRDCRNDFWPCGDVARHVAISGCMLSSVAMCDIYWPFL